MNPKAAGMLSGRADTGFRPAMDRVDSPAAVSVEGVGVSYGTVVALDGADLRIAPGVVCGLVGLNGAGKSSLLKVIAGVVQPTTGRVLVFGESPASAGRSSRIAYVPQSEAIDWDFPISVAEVVMTGRYGRMGWRRRPAAGDRTMVAAALAQVELSDLAGRQIGQLSGGQRKRTFVARGLAQGADLLLLDEPFAGIDKASEVTLIRILREAAGNGTTIVVATHDLAGLSTLCDEAALVQRRVLLHDAPEVVLRPEHLALAFGVGTR